MNHNALCTRPSRDRSPAWFFFLVFALSLPLWLVDSLGQYQLLQGLPLTAVMVVCPLLAALMLIALKSGIAGVAEHLKRSFDFRRITRKAWYAPILLLMPATSIVAYGVMRLLDVPLPATDLSPWLVPALFLLFFPAALAEELGWSGYALDPLQERWGALPASLILGLVWVTWHIVPLLQVQRTADWIAWWSLSTLATRALHTWLYNNTGRSVFGVALFHSMTNVSWQMFPNHGSHYDPRIFGLILTVVAGWVTMTWGWRTLSHRGTRLDIR
ncbi:CPBP family intramembrane glutamic endopeptidase [Peristeroidobacter agariperforans]|uniref:CPBP family intramembrane glutamic endopeptidase n=1 Tax=Peristeroidobacter agariperforans TaxID=268404 RepID=UPI00101CB0D4|nr:type II CAAX endopeptidase family protein [Peristeroidobacter agariperforans]